MLPERYTCEVVAGGGLTPKPRALLFVRLVAARNMPNTDLFSKTDCYVRCWSLPGAGLPSRSPACACTCMRLLMQWVHMPRDAAE